MIIVDQKKLRVVSTEIPFEQSKEILEQLKKEIPETAVGLAAIQIGLPSRVFITKFKKNHSVWVNPQITEYELIEWVNPKIEEFDNDKIESEEGCLSIPNKRVFVKRSKQIIVSAQASIKDRNKFVLLDEEAVIFQHEFDHINGVLIIDKVAGRNDPCPCGSGKKFKKCCGN